MHIKEFEKLTVGELRSIVETSEVVELSGDDSAGEPIPSLGLSMALSSTYDWIDGEFPPPEPEAELNIDMFNDEGVDSNVEDGHILGFSWRSEAETYNEKKWVKVESVVDSGASAPVAPPTMLPGVKITQSPGSLRGQKFTSASKHKLKNLGEQRICACSEEGEELEVLFQIADVSKPLVSVSAICERGNRVIFGRSGGVVKNCTTGAEIPFYRKNGIYVLSLWLQDGDDHLANAPFRRP